MKITEIQTTLTVINNCISAALELREIPQEEIKHPSSQGSLSFDIILKTTDFVKGGAVEITTKLEDLIIGTLKGTGVRVYFVSAGVNPRFPKGFLYFYK